MKTKTEWLNDLGFYLEEQDNVWVLFDSISALRDATMSEQVLWTKLMKQDSTKESPALEQEEHQATQVIIDFAQVGTAGPFPVVDGRVQLSVDTMQDLVRMLRPTYEAEQAAPEAAPREPTQEMVDAVMSLVDLEVSDPEDHRYDDGSKLAAQICRAVLALAPQQEPAGEVVSASCDHATVRWLRQTSSVGAGDPCNSRAWPKVSGVSRDEGHSRALLVFFAAEPTDDEVRAVHDTLAQATQAGNQQASQEPVAISEAIERMAADRYKVVPSHESMFHRWAVVAGTGTQQLYLGREVECQNMARKFAGAFLDGAFVAMQKAAPQPAPAPLSRDQIREVFMAHGFTIKEGQTDLKQYVYDAAYALLRAARAPADSAPEDAGGSNWQDISTAPKDGTRFVAVGQNYGLDSEAQHTCMAQWFRGCWIEVSEWNEISELKYLTHWMPLPPLPGNAARKQGGK